LAHRLQRPASGRHGGPRPTLRVYLSRPRISASACSGIPSPSEVRRPSSLPPKMCYFAAMAKKKPRKKARRKTGADDGDPRWTSKLPPAPGELRILQAFVNTADLRQGTDLAGPRALAEWLELWGLAAGLELTSDHLQNGKEVREAMRTLIRCRPGGAPRAAARIDRAGKASPVFARLDAEGRGRFESPAETFDGALARLVSILVGSQLVGTWERLRACADKTCRAAFYDFSKNRSAVWCTVQCGNRASALAYRWRNINSVRKMDAARSWVRGR